jgi:hypothetical protein
VIYDSTGSYKVAFMAAGGAVFIAGLLCLPMRLIHDYVVKSKPIEKLYVTRVEQSISVYCKNNINADVNNVNTFSANNCET